MKLRAANVPTMAPVFQKPARRISGALRHLVFSKGIAGTKCLMFRAGRYSVHQFIRSFSTFFTALVVLPRCLGKILWYLKPKNPIGLQWATAISASVKCTVMGVPSIIRSAWTSIKVSFYSIGAAIYHSVESVKSVFMFKILEAISHGIQALRSFVVGVYQSITIPLWHLTDYIGTVMESFRTGTIETFDRFKAKEQIWARNLLTYLDNGRNYVTGVVHYVLAAISALFGKIWTAISSSIERFQTSSSNGGARVKESAYAVWEKVLNSAVGVGNVVKTVFLTVSNLFARAPGVVKEKAQYVVVRIHDTTTKAVTQVKIAMTDLLHMIQGVGEKLHEDEVHLKTVARDIHSKTHDLADGVKVGTVNIIKKVGQTGRVLKEQLELYFRAASGKLYAGKLFVKRRVAVSIEQLGAGLHHLRDQISETGRSARIIISSSVHKVHDVVGKAAGPIVAPFVYMYRLPRRVYQSFSAPSLSSYIFVPTVGVLAYMLYLKIECRYKRETYARQLAANPKVRNGCQEFHLSDSVLRQCMEKLRSQIDLGLNPATRDKSTVKCFNTYVQDLPTGKEKGQFLALDLGGTNFRVLLITLNGRHFDMQSKIYVVPQEIMTGDGEQLFDHIASCLESFALQHRVANKNLPLGFTFSFPLLQIGLKSGILQRWTKGFNCANTVGNDVVQMLQAALQKKNARRRRQQLVGSGDPTKPVVGSQTSLQGQNLGGKWLSSENKKRLP